MTILDANILLYAYNADAPQQAGIAEWLSTLVESGETIGLPWVTIWAFVRIATNPRVWGNPLSPEQAFAIVDEWMEMPNVVPLGPGTRHVELLRQSVVKHAASGALVTDAVLAAHALEHGASLASTDRDFSRFTGLRWVNPMNP